MDYTPPRSRDATAAIRGFVYQVNLSIVRWLDLSGDDLLRLEAGEDIDHIAAALNDEQPMILEQVHSGSGSVTLRTSKAVEALANFFDHRRANEQVPLGFLYTTLAKPGREQDSPFPFPQKGIEQWEFVRCGEADDPDAVLNCLRTLLTTATKPRRIPEDLWLAYQGFVSEVSVGELHGFVTNFEWGVGAIGFEVAENTILRRLQERQLSSDPEVAHQHYCRLFLEVFKMLADDTPTVLSAGSLLSCLETELSEADLGLMTRLQSQVTDLQRRVGRNERSIVELNTKLEGHLLEEATGVRYTATPRFDLQPPLLPRRLTTRSALVTELASELDQAFWLHIDGGAGSGKSTLANLITRELDQQSLWIQLSGLSPEETGNVLHASLSTVERPGAGESFREHVRRIVDAVDGRLILALDDLPRLVDADHLTTILNTLVEEWSDSALRLLSTSHHSLSLGIQETAGECLHGLTVPLLEDDEMRELLAAYDCPESRLTDSFVTTLNAFSHRYPLLAVANARFCSNSGWNVGIEQFQDLAAGDSLAAIDDEVLERALRTTAAEGRQLLYRLSLVTRPAKESEIEGLASVAPAIREPAEQVHLLSGLWLREEGDGGLRPIPLIRRIALRTLDTSVQEECHRVLANCVIAKRKLDQYDAADAITHFVAANENTRAVAMLAEALMRLRDALPDDVVVSGDSIADANLLLLWASSALPSDVPRTVRVLTRSVQIQISHRTGQPSDYLEDDLFDLLDEASEDEALAVVFAAAQVSDLLAKRDFDRTLALGVSAIAIAEHATLPDGEPFEASPEAPAEFILWLLANKVERAVAGKAWLEAVVRLSPESRKRLFGMDLASESAVIFANQLWLNEGKKREEGRDWEAIIAAYEEWYGLAVGARAPVLAAAIVRASTMTLCGEFDDPGRASERIRQVREDFAWPRDAEYLLLDAEAQVALKLDDAGTAVTKMDEALALRPQEMPLTLADSYYRSARARAKTSDLQGAIEHLEAAAKLAEEEQTGAYILACTYGDLAIANYLAGDYERAFSWGETSLNSYLNLDESDTQTQCLTALLGHAFGFMWARLESNEPLTLRDGEPYWEPWVGMLLHSSPALAQRCTPLSRVMVITGLAQFGAQAGIEDRPGEWADLAMNEPNAHQSPSVMYLAATQAVSWRILNGAYGPAAELADRSAAFIFARGDGAIDDWHTLLPDLDELLHASASAHGGVVTERGLAIGFLPAAFQTAETAVQSMEDACEAAGLIAEAISSVGFVFTDAAAWDQGCSSLRAAYGPSPAEELEVVQSTTDFVAVRIACLVLRTVTTDPSFHEAAQSHIEVALRLDGLAGGNEFVNRAFARFLVNFWSYQLANSRFAFSGPLLAEAALNDAGTAMPKEAARIVLNSIMTSLGFQRRSIPENVRTWLAGG